MKKLGILAALLLIPGLAFAGWNLQQSSDGTAHWVNGNGDSIPAPSGPLTVTIESISTASTQVIVSPVTGTIIRVYAVQNGSTSGTQNVIQLHSAPASSLTFTSVPVSFALPAASTHTRVDSGVLTGPSVEGGGLIAIRTDGAGSWDDADVNFVIVIDPK